MRLVRLIPALLVVATVTNCATDALDERYGSPSPRDRLLAAPPANGVDYWRDVQPVLERRCVSCHACYDAPCQLDISAFEGIDRGASAAPVYDGTRLVAADPTRLFQDAHSTAAWREKGFHPVLNERTQSTDANLEAGVMARMLALKRAHPLPGEPRVPASITLGLDRSQQCPSIAEFESFAAERPLWGMPYGLPGLTDREQTTLLAWIAEGAPYYAPPGPSREQRDAVARWEAFLNGDSRKARLMSRYIFEHLFLADIYFDSIADERYFRLVRSRTPPGVPIDPIASRRPYDDPGVERVFYRLSPVRTTILAKTHMPYALGPSRMARWRELFLDESYEVTELPSYAVDVASNPFVAFAQIPVRSRYKFMLDEARFTIMGFIKGPVCRGQIAVDVIEDQFWVVFVDPDSDLFDGGGQFLREQSENLALPAQSGSTSTVLLAWLEYSGREKAYLKAKQAIMEEILGNGARVTLDLVWDGDGSNQNAALTVFRHFDSASVLQGFVGGPPKTAWLIEYPLLERIHYLLVAGFDVYGNVGHQLNSRLYMDFLRMEGEFNFLTLLPEDVRVQERDFWYRGASEDVKSYIYGSHIYFNGRTGIDYRSGDPKAELLDMLRDHVGSALNVSHRLASRDPVVARELERLSELRGTMLSALPPAALLTVTGTSSGRDEVFTLVHNDGHSNVSHVFSEATERLPEEDTLTVVPGYVGAYPNALYRVPRARLGDFVAAVSGLSDEQSYAALLDRFGVRRTDAGFWAQMDFLNDDYARMDPVQAGVLDLNRLENR